MNDRSSKLHPVLRFFAGVLGSLGAGIFIYTSLFLPFREGAVVAITLGPFVGWFLKSARSGLRWPWLASIWLPLLYFTIALPQIIVSSLYPDSAGARTGAFTLALLAFAAIRVCIQRRFGPDAEKPVAVNLTVVEQSDWLTPTDAVLRQFSLPLLVSMAGLMLLPLWGVDFFSGFFWGATAVLLIIVAFRCDAPPGTSSHGY
ncbi:hypothetical protein [Halothiobacillus sp.]|uniref:hypothetical protein n=1 Tax=Halothiobacillus sp. TaxID=1891311 RepID=UPI002AD4DF4C|nr:hypothetical protein [Halothiobacillus sp.]